MIFFHFIDTVLLTSGLGGLMATVFKHKTPRAKEETDSQVTEDSFRESEERYRRLVEQSPYAIAIHVDGKFTYINPAGVKLIGAPNAGAIIGKSLLDVVHPDYHKLVTQRVHVMVHEGEDVPVLEEKFIRFDGSTVDVEVSAIPFKYKGKRAVQVIARDITAQKLTATTVKEWQERYEKLLSITGEIVYDRDIEHGRTIWGGTMQSVFGYSTDEIETGTIIWEEQIHPEDSATVQKKTGAALRESDSLELEYRVRHKNGTYRHVLDRSFIFRDIYGKPTRLLGSLSDVTDKKLAEQARVENERRYKTLFEFSPSGLMLQDALGTIVSVNNALASTVGYTREELIGKNVSMLVPQTEHGEVQSHIEKILSGKILEHRVTNTRKDGSRVTIELRERKISLPDGSDGILVVSNDVSERLRNEQEIKQQFEQLETIYKLTDTINRAEELDPIYQEALSALTGTLKTDRASILLFDPDGVLRFKAWRGLSDSYRRKTEGHSPWTRDTSNPTPILVTDVRDDASLASLLPALEKENIHSLAFIPLVHQNRLLGKFMVYYPERHLFTEAETQLLATVAGHISFAIERRHAERQVIQSEERYRALAEAAHDAIFIIDRNDTVLYVNSYAAKMFNAAPDKIIGKPRTHLFPGDTGVRQGRVLKDIFKTGKPVQAENYFRIGDKGYWHDSYLVPMKNEQGDIVSILGISRNITERRNAEDALRKSAEQQGLVLRSLPMVFYTTGATESMPTTWISDQVKGISGFSPEDFVGNPGFWQSRLHPDDRLRVINDYESVVGKGTVRIEYRWKCANGEYRWFSDQTVLINDRDGKPKEIIGIWLDITNQKLAEEALRESEAKWRTLMENSPGLIHMIDRDGNILYINRATVGYERDKVIGSTIFDYVTPETAELMRNQVREVFEQKRAVWFQVPAAGPYGTEAWYTCIIGPIMKDDKVVSAIMESVDITEHKRREQLQTAVYRIAEVADSSQTLEELFLAVHEIIREVMRANNFYIALYDEAENHLTFPYFVDEIDSSPLPAAPGKGLTSYVLQSGKPLLCNGEKFKELDQRGETELIGTQSVIWLGVPLMVENKAIGVMAVQDYHDEQAYGVQELHILEYISSQLAMAIRRKQTEEVLRSSEERYRLIFEESKDCIYITSAEGKIIDINPAGVELFGYASKDELINIDVAHELYWDAKKREEESRLVRRQGYVQDFELELKRKEGTKLIILDTATTVRDAHGIVVGYRGIMRDMTERKHAEEALRVSETKLREIVEHSTNLFYSYSPDLLLTYVSPQTRSFFDCEPDEALGKWIELATENPINTFGHKLARRAIETGQRQMPYRLELAGKKGRKIWVEVNESPVVISGKTAAVVGSLTDITDRVKADEEITKLRQAVETSGEVIFITDRTGVITYINPEFTNLYGYTEEEIIGKQTPRILKGGNLSDEEYGRLWKKLVNKQFVKREFFNKSKQGKQIIVDSSISPILNELGTIDGFLAIQLDVTEKKRLEEQFLRTQRMESLGTLAGGVAHDLNNVLAPILLSIEVLKRYATTDHAKKILSTIEMSADRGKQIIKQILSFARGTEGERGNIQLKHLIKEMEQIVRETFPKTIDVHSYVQKDLWVVAGDPTQLHQVLLNLCVNARDAMPEGGNLELKAENILIDEHFAKMQYGAKVGEYVVVNVTDTGTGIPPEVLPRIFDPFYTTKAQGMGTGIGLSTVHAIVKGHQGFVDVYSHQGKGTTFKVFIPALEATEAARELKSTTEYPVGNGELILVVDDEASVRDITRYTLEMYRYTVLTANDGAKAVSLYTENSDKIALVITDMMMPVMDGAATIRALKKINPVVKIIASSGLSTSVQANANLTNDVEAFIAKPYSAESLLTTIHNVLTKS